MEEKSGVKTISWGAIVFQFQDVFVGCIVCFGILFVSLFTSCIKVPTNSETYDEELTVHCVLRNDRDPIDVYLERTLCIHECDTVVAVSGAKVQLSDGDREVGFTELGDKPGVYRCDDTFLTIQECTRYTLAVADSGECVLSATTTTPGPFRILSPKDGDTLTVSSDLSLTWSCSVGAADYHIYVLAADSSSSFRYIHSDTTIFVPAERFMGNGHYLVEVYAVDKNYADYTRSDRNDPDMPDIMNIRDAKGVFGSAIGKEVTFYIK